jgi:hypothetical protein
VFALIALLFLALSTFAGYALSSRLLPPEMAGSDADISSRLPLAFPLYFTVGAVFSIWLTYLCCYAFRSSGSPMLYGTMLAFFVLLAIAGGTMFMNIKKHGLPAWTGTSEVLAHMRWKWSHWKLRLASPATVFFAAAAVLIAWLMCYTFFESNGQLFFGYTVFSDFGPHSALIRSFSRGANFPTQYPHYPDGTIRYHFLYQFFIGALEFMGLRIDLAFNLITIICLFNVLALLYVLALKLTGRRLAGILTCVLFMFRSSLAFWRFMAEGAPYYSLHDMAMRIMTVDKFIGQTAHDDWGLWAVNVYANQRHFALGISVLLLAVIFMLPLVRGKYDGPRDFFLGNAERGGGYEMWLPWDIRRAAALGLLLGGASFINGSAVVAALSILAVMAVFSYARAEYALIAATALSMAALEARFFAPGGGVAQPSFWPWFLAEEPSLAGMVKYVAELTGFILPVAALGALCLKFAAAGRSGPDGNGPALTVPMALAFLAPFALTFTLALTPDITVNHKYLMISLALTNIFAAYALVRLWDFKPGSLLLRAGKNILFAAVLFTLTSTGVTDWFSVRNLNGRDRSLVMPMESELMDWIEKNTPTDSIFLTDRHVIHPVYLSGRFEFYGWPYFAMSAGHDTYLRENAAASMFTAQSPEDLRGLAEEHNISYILIDSDLRANGFNGLPVNERNIADTFGVVYNDGNVTIYECR